MDTNVQVLKVMEQRASQAAKVYGARPCPPLLELFRDFVQQCGRNLRGLLAAQESFRRWEGGTCGGTACGA